MFLSSSLFVVVFVSQDQDVGFFYRQQGSSFSFSFLLLLACFQKKVKKQLSEFVVF